MSMLTSIVAVVRAAAEQFVPGVARLENAAVAVVDFVKSVRPTLSSDDQVALDAELPDLLARMNRDVDQAIRDLRGE